VLKGWYAVSVTGGGSGIKMHQDYSRTELQKCSILKLKKCGVACSELILKECGVVLVSVKGVVLTIFHSQPVAYSAGEY
jgi:hypothetical protein